MNLVRWNPLGHMTLLQDGVNRLFESALSGLPQGVDDTPVWAPATDIRETDNALLVTLDIPGVDPKNIEVRVENNVLTIRGERREERKLNREYFHRAERLYGSFARSFALSTMVEADNIQATCRDGVLRIALPKTEQAKPKRIEVMSPASADAVEYATIGA